MDFSKISQIGIAVSDVKIAASELGRLIGVAEWRFVTWDASIIEPLVSLHEGKPNPEWKAELAFASVGGVEIELIQDVAGASGYRDFVGKRGLGLRHLMFILNDLEGVEKIMSAMGVSISTCIKDASGVLQWAIFDTSELVGFDLEIKLG